MGDTQHATTRVRPGGATSALVLEGKSCGLLKSVSGGKICADVSNVRTGFGSEMKKHIGAVRYEEFTLDVGFTMGASVYEWIASTWKMKYTKHSGSILDCNDKLEVQIEREFTDALLTEVTIPKVDAKSKEAAWLRLKFSPERVRMKRGSGKASGPEPRNPEKIFVPSRFKLEIDGLDCGTVRAIDPLTVRQKVVLDAAGEKAEIDRHPGALTLPDLKIYFSEVMNDTWKKWFEDLVIQGKSGADMEKSGKLTLLSPNDQPLASIAFSNLAPFEMGIEDDDDGQRRGTAKVFCEAMDFKLGA